MPRKLSGAALYRVVEGKLRTEWLASYGLPLERYAFRITDDNGINLSAEFRRDNGATIELGPIWYSDDGTINQIGEISLTERR